MWCFEVVCPATSPGRCKCYNRKQCRDASAAWRPACTDKAILPQYEPNENAAMCQRPSTVVTPQPDCHAQLSHRDLAQQANVVLTQKRCATSHAMQSEPKHG